MLLIITGASGSGKTSLVKKLEKAGLVKRIVTTTTREQRNKEVNGIDYNFIPTEDFNIEKMAEYTRFGGNLYGTPKSILYDAIISKNQLFAVILDKTGIQNISELFTEKERAGQVFTLYLQVNEKELWERLVNRDGISKARQRIDADRIAGLFDHSGYDFVLENSNDFSKTFKQMKKIIVNLTK